MTNDTAFDTLLTNIEPDKDVKKHAQKAHERVRGHLESDESTFSQYVTGSFLYGSYKRETADGDIKDVDIVLLTNFDPDNDDDKPSKVLPKLKKALNQFYKDPDATSYSRKSIQVLDPLPDVKDSSLTLDIIPAIATNTEDDVLLVPDMEDDVWVKSHPKGHLIFTSTLNDEDHGNGKFVPLVKIMKHWWKQYLDEDYTKPKGFWLEVLAGSVFDASKETYAEHFTSILQSISSMYTDYEKYTEVPDLEDPGLPGETIKTSMSIKEFVHFMDAVNADLEIAKVALESDDEDESNTLWHKIFGEDFPKSEKSGIANITKLLGFLDLYPAPKEQFLQRDFGILTRDGGYNLSLNAWVTKNKGFRDNWMTLLPILKKGSSLVFSIRNCNVPAPYKIMWKIKNTGGQAKRLGQLRGEIVPDAGNSEKEESTLYTGTHYAECFIIKNSICVAKRRIDVHIS